MKKSIIAASAASLALAAMPVVGAFADKPTSTIQDTLNLTLNPTCKITRTGSAAADVSGASQNLQWSNPASNETGTYTGKLFGGKAADIGTSTLSITCNDTTNGHSLSMSQPALQATTGEGTTVTSSINYVANTLNDGTSGWNVTATAANNDLGITAGTIIPSGGQIYALTTNKAVDASTISLKYRVSTSTTQPAGTYSGNVVYTLTYGADVTPEP